MELDKSVGRFEKIVAPSNYKRPTALVTAKMVEKAKEKLTELGYIEALDRRFATETDLDINNVFFVDKSSSITDVFGEITKEAVVDVNKLSKVEDISIKDFITNVVPSKKREVVLPVFCDIRFSGMMMVQTDRLTLTHTVRNPMVTKSVTAIVENHLNQNLEDN